MFQRGRNILGVRVGGSQPPHSPTDISKTFGQYQQLAPWQEPPPGSTPLFLSAKAATVGAGNVVTPAALQTTLQQSELGVIRGFSLFVENPTAATNVLWTLLINGAAVPGLNAVTILGRAAASVQRPLSVLVFIPAGATVGVQITNVDGGAYNVGADLEGWKYSTVTGSDVRNRPAIAAWETL